MPPYHLAPSGRQSPMSTRRGHRGVYVPCPPWLVDVARPPDVQHVAPGARHAREQLAQHCVTPLQLERPRGGRGRVAGAPLERAARVVAEAAAKGGGGGAHRGVAVLKELQPLSVRGRRLAHAHQPAHPGRLGWAAPLSWLVRGEALGRAAPFNEVLDALVPSRVLQDEEQARPPVEPPRRRVARPHRAARLSHGVEQTAARRLLAAVARIRHAVRVAEAEGQLHLLVER
eukprot:scaffold40084_cov69-Phaeocystis_antarctica.AAC.4